MRTIHRDVVGIIIESKNKKFLFGRRIGSQSFGGMWTIVGGGIEDGETSEDAVKREVYEETGLDISKEKLSKVSDDINGQTEKTLRTGERVLCTMDFTDFKIKLEKNSEEISLVFEPAEFVEMKWFKQKEISSLLLSPTTRELLIKVNIIQKEKNG